MPYEQQPLYLGFDLSTQQLKALAVTSDLKVEYESIFDFDADARGYKVVNGVMTYEDDHTVYAPVGMWIQALDTLLEKLKEAGLECARVRAISGAGQQHGCVYWRCEGERMLGSLDPKRTLEDQLLPMGFSHPFSPNWQDASTQKECDEFDQALGDKAQLAQETGSKAHHRFTGPQILHRRRRNPAGYARTSRISLVSSFLASLFLGHVAPIDISDVCGMNLWSIRSGTWNTQLMSLASSGSASDLAAALGPIRTNGGGSMGTISPYFVHRYGFAPDCAIAPFTGDNPATLLALPLRPLDAIVSLGTSTTFLMSTPEYRPDPAVHFFNHPTTPGLYMFMLCYKNGGLAREQVRDALPTESSSSPNDPWSAFNALALSTPPLGQHSPTDPMKLGLYFPRPEIVPRVRAGTWRFTYHVPPISSSCPATLTESTQDWTLPSDDVHAIIESQLLSLRLRSAALVASPRPGLLPQPRRVYLVGGGARNPAIARIAGEVLGGAQGVFRLDVGANACALGAAYKAVWARERGDGETFEEFVGKRWREEEFVEKIDEGYREGVFEKYGEALKGFAEMEQRVLEQEQQG